MDTLDGGQVVNPAPTTTVVASSLNPSTFGQSVTFTATVTSGAGTPSGTVQFQADGVSLGGAVALVAGQAQTSTSALAVGDRAITAAYSGATSFAASTGTLAPVQTVNAAPTTTAITSALPDPSVVGEVVTVQVSVTSAAGTPTGGVTVGDGGGTTCAITLSAGVGSCQLTFPSAGARSITADYAGDGTFAASSDTDSHQVNPAPTTTTVASSQNPSTFGQSVTFTATVTSGAGTPTGTVQFQADGVNLGSAVALDVGGQAQTSTAALAVGARAITATYGGAGNFAGSLGALGGGQVVNPATTTTAITSALPDPSVVGQAVTVQVSVTSTGGTPTGTVTVGDGGGTTCQVTLSGGAGSCDLTFTTAGARTLTAIYAGDGSFGASTSGGEAHAVEAAATTTAITNDSPDPSAAGQQVTVSYTVAVTAPGAGTPSGNVTVSDGAGTSCSAPAAAGSCLLTFAVAGARTLTATYAGDGNFLTSTSEGAAHSVVAGAADTLRAVSSLTPTGTVGGPAAPAPIVIVVDAYGNPVSGETVTFTPGTGSGTVSSGSVATDANGQASVTWTLGTTPGAQTLLAASGTLVGSPVTFSATANAGTATTLHVTGIGDPITAGTSASATVTARDAFGNVATGYTGTVSFSSSDAAAILPAPYAFTVGDAGVRTFTGIQLRTAGEWVVTVTDQVNAALTATQGAITVQPAGAATLTVIGIADPITAGVASNVRVTALDPFGNVATGYTGTIAFTTDDPGAVTLPANYTFLPGDNGAHVFTAGVTLITAGERTVTATDQSVPSIVGSQTAISVRAAGGSAAQTTATVPAGTAGSPTAIVVTVRDTFGNKLTGAAGQLAGSVTGANTAALAAAVEQTGDTTYTTSYTPADAGTDQVAITLGGVAVSGSPFESSVSAGAAASVTAVDGDNQVGLPGKAVNIPPAVLVEDAQGNPVPGATVTFAVTGGGGSAAGTSAVTDAAGVARVGSWSLGGTAGANALQASITGDDVTFAATGQAAAYDIEVRYFGASSPTASQQAAFAAAAARWEQLVFGDVADIPVAEDLGTVCSAGMPAVDEIMDDLVIYAKVDSIDGPGQILGQAGPCLIRGTGGLPVVGVMFFDSADVAGLESSGQLELVITHEMGHVIGLGTLWNNPPFTLLANPCPGTGTCTTDPHFTGTRGLAAFDAVGGTSYTAGAKVPVEETGGAGTRNGHWRESVFDNELMTGYLNAGSNPLSIVSVGSFWDMGYLVSYADANAFAWSASPPALRLGGIDVGDDILRVPIGVVGPGGRVERFVEPSQ
jgi:hypothetical protein